jgi:hypothetical protein
MVFGFGRKSSARAQANPLAAYDAELEALERQAAEIRKAAATLLAVRGELTRGANAAARQCADLETRLQLARQQSDSLAERRLTRDRDQAQMAVGVGRERLASADDDLAWLLKAASELSKRIGELRLERQLAHARLVTGQAIEKALSEPAEKIERALALDAARDEVERAHALAEIYREEARQKG